MENQTDLPKPQKDLPKPQTDLPASRQGLPLPEKELSAGEDLTPQGHALQTQTEKPHHVRRIFLSFLFVVLAVLIGGVAFFLGRNSKLENTGQIAKNNSPTPTEFQRLIPLGDPPPGSIEYLSENFEKRTFKITDKIYGTGNYPQELTSAPESGLIGIKCSRLYRGYLYNDDGKAPANERYSYYSEQEKKIYLNPYMTYFADKAARLHEKEISDTFVICESENNNKFILYTISNRSSSDPDEPPELSYLAKINPDSSISDIAYIPDSELYFSCHNLLQMDINNLYIQCYGGDVGRYTYIYRVDYKTGEIKSIYYCSTRSDFVGDPISKCEVKG